MFHCNNVPFSNCSNAKEVCSKGKGLLYYSLSSKKCSSCLNNDYLVIFKVLLFINYVYKMYVTQISLV